MSETLIEIRNLSMGFHDHSEVLFSGLDLKIVAGQLVTIVGESGVGKTTLLRAIAGLLPFDGDIVIKGRPVKNDGSGVSTGPVVLVTQQPNLWDHLTALDNVALVRRVLHAESEKVARARSLDFLRTLEVHTTAHRYPHSLSGGEQQRIGLARGLAAEKPILLLDEVTSNIDVNRRDIVAKALLSLVRQGRVIIFVTHDLRTAQRITSHPLELTRDGLVEREIMWR